MKERGELPRAGAVPAKPADAETARRLRRRRIGRAILIALIALLALAGAGYAYATFVPAGRSLTASLLAKYYYRSRLAVAVTDGSAPLDAVTVRFEQSGRIITEQTGAAGTLLFDTEAVQAGPYTISLEKPGYLPMQRTGALVRATLNDLGTVVLSKPTVPTYSLLGYLVDWVSGQPVQDAQVTVAGKTVRSNPAGEYRFDGLASGSYTAVISRSGYQSREISRAIAAESVTDAKLELVPTAQLLFVSAREGGKRNLYLSAYDGTGLRPFVGALTAGERLAPLIAPDGRTVVFASSEDSLKDANGYALVRLMLAAADGSGVRRLSDDVGYSFAPVWSPNGQYLFASGYTAPDRAVASNRIYRVQAGSSLDIGEAASLGSFSPDSQWFAYATLSGQTDAGYALKILNVLSGERRTLATVASYPTGLVVDPSGTQLVYEMTVGGVRRQSGVAFAGGPPADLPVADVNLRRYVLAPGGGAKLFAETRDGKRDLYLLDGKGAEQRLTELGTVSADMIPRWSDSGAYVTFAVRRDAETALYAVARSGGPARKLADVPDF